MEPGERAGHKNQSILKNLAFLHYAPFAYDSKKVIL